MSDLQKASIIRGLNGLHYIGMVALFVGGWLLFYHAAAIAGAFATHTLAVCVVYALLLQMLNRLYGAYKVGLCRVNELVYNQLIANLVSLFITYVLVCLLATAFVEPWHGVGIAAVQCLFSALWTMLANQLYFRLHKPKSTLVIYNREQDLKKLEGLQCFSARWDVQKTIQVEELEAHDLPQNDNVPQRPGWHFQQLTSVMEKYEVIFVSGISTTLRNGIEKYCIEKNKECFFVPHTGDVITAGAEHVRSFAVPIYTVHRSAPSPEFLLVKRLCDILLSLTGLVLLSPVMLLTAIAIKCYDGGPVLYRQVRLTKDGRQFSIMKFRSMRMDAEKDGVARLATCNDARITQVGKWIRMMRIDELPQLFNVLSGQMSLVGPRPERPEIAEQYLKDLPAFSLRLQVKAGLTGYAQIYGRYSSEPRDKLKLDLMYINRMSLIEDVKLIFATVRILFVKESAAGVVEGQTTATHGAEKSA